MCPVNKWMCYCPTNIALKCDTWLCPTVLHSTYIHVDPNSVKKAGVCAAMSIWMMHIKDHLWTIEFTPYQRVSNSSNVRWTGHDGEWLKWGLPCEAALLYAPQGVEMGGCGSPSQNRIDTVDRPEPDNMLSAFHNARHSIKCYTK